MDFTKDFAMDITNNSKNNFTKHFTNDFNEDLSRAQRVIIGRARVRYKPDFQKLIGKTKKKYGFGSLAHVARDERALKRPMRIHFSKF